MSLPSTAAPRLSSRPIGSDFVAGIGLPLRAARLVLRHGRLKVLVAISAILVALTLVALLVWVAPAVHRAAQGLIAADGALTSALSAALGWLLALGVVVIGALTLPNLVLAPLQDPLGEATEAAAGGFVATPFTLGRFLRGVWVSLRHTLMRSALMLAGLLLLLPLNVIPGAGPVLFSGASVLWTTWWLAVEYLSGPMARHLMGFRAVLRVLWARRTLALGFGLALYALLWIPVLNFFLMPLAIVAGTLLFDDLRARGQLPG